jgi:hypothetical protein
VGSRYQHLPIHTAGDITIFLYIVQEISATSHTYSRRYQLPPINTAGDHLPIHTTGDINVCLYIQQEI